MTLGWVWMILFWGWVASEAALAFTTHTRRNGGAIHDRGSLRILWIVIGASVTAVTWYGDSHPHTIFHGVPAVRLAAVTLMLIGLLIRWTAILQLGRSFSVNVAIHATQTVHKTGLFRLVRHPSYTGLILIFFAVGLFTRNWLGLALLFVPTTAGSAVPHPCRRSRSPRSLWPRVCSVQPHHPPPPSRHLLSPSAKLSQAARHDLRSRQLRFVHLQPGPVHGRAGGGDGDPPQQ